MDNVYVATGGSAIILATLLQVLKNTPYFPWLSRASGKVNFAVSLAMAFAASAGISHHFDIGSDGQFHFLLDGNLYDIGHFLIHWASQWCTQHGFYKGFIVPAETLGEIRGLLERVLTPPATSPGAEKAKQ